MELRARKAGEKEFTKDTKKYGIEVFVDANNGNYLYLCETGAMDAVAGQGRRRRRPRKDGEGAGLEERDGAAGPQGRRTRLQ